MVIPEDAERVARVDYAMDIRAYGFALYHTWFVGHSRTGINHYLDGQRTTSVTLGKMPGAQIILYDKTQEIKDKGGSKVMWWQLWADALKKLGQEPLDKTDSEDHIWRVELRAGKKHLRDGWQIKTVNDLKQRLPSALARMARKVRYCQPSSDTNRSRWPNHSLWELVQNHLENQFGSMNLTLDPPTAKAIHAEAHSHLLENQALGLLATYAHCSGQTLKEALSTLSGRAQQTSTEMDKRMEKARRRYILY